MTCDLMRARPPRTDTRGPKSVPRVHERMCASCAGTHDTFPVPAGQARRHRHVKLGPNDPIRNSVHRSASCWRCGVVWCGVVWCGVVWCEGEGWKVVVKGVEAEGKRKKAEKAESKTPRKGALRNGGMLPSSLRSAGSPRTPPHRKGQGRLIGTLGCTYAPRDLIAFLPRALGFAHRRIDASNPSNDTSERRSCLYGPRNRVCGDSRKDGKTSG